MGQIQNVGKPGITVTPIDRETGPGAGPGTTGNRDIYLGEDSAKNSTLNDSLVLGYQAGNAGMADAHLDGTIIIGSQAAQSLLAAQTVPDGVGGNIIMGLRAASKLTYGNGNIILGQDTLTESPGVNNAADQDNVMIGNYVAQFNAGRWTENVIVGYKAGQGGTFGFGTNIAMQGCVILGSNACAGQTHANIGGAVIIGTQAAANLGSSLSGPQGHIIIGTQCAPQLAGGTDIVMIGQAIQCGTQTYSATAVGSIASVRDACTVIGYNAGGFAGGSGNPGLGCICIGAGAGGQLTNGSAWQFIVESFDNIGFVRHGILYGTMLDGNLAVGSIQAAGGKDFDGATNALKLQDGTVGTGSGPATGGYFYVSLGELHWVGSSGTDTVLAPA